VSLLYPKRRLLVPSSSKVTVSLVIPVIVYIGDDDANEQQVFVAGPLKRSDVQWRLTDQKEDNLSSSTTATTATTQAIYRTVESEQRGEPRVQVI
jgi:hypothetical protein